MIRSSQLSRCSRLSCGQLLSGRLGNQARLCGIAVASYGAIHAPQPILAVLQGEFGADKAAISLLTTATLLPLGLAPLFYGLALASAPARPLLLWSLGLLAACSLGLAVAPGYEAFLALRVAQGLVAPAVLAACMTLAGSFGGEEKEPGRIARSLAGYVAASIFGGFFGRFLTGALASAGSWRLGLACIGLEVVLAVALAVGLPRDGKGGFTRVRPQELRDVWRRPMFAPCYLSIFLGFFSFMALMNLIPFRMAELAALAGQGGGAASTLRTGSLYAGYLIGIVVSLRAPRTVAWLGAERRAVLLGAVVVLLSIPVFLAEAYWALLAGMFLLSAGMFQMHAVAPGWLNSMGDGRRGVVNGLYLFFYYMGGALGSLGPAVLYRRAGWTWCLATLGLLQVASVWLAWRTGAAPARQGRAR